MGKFGKNSFPQCQISISWWTMDAHPINFILSSQHLACRHWIIFSTLGHHPLGTFLSISSQGTPSNISQNQKNLHVAQTCVPLTSTLPPHIITSIINKKRCKIELEKKLKHAQFLSQFSLVNMCGTHSSAVPTGPLKKKMSIHAALIEGMREVLCCQDWPEILACVAISHVENQVMTDTMVIFWSWVHQYFSYNIVNLFVNGIDS